VSAFHKSLKSNSKASIGAFAICFGFASVALSINSSERLLKVKLGHWLFAEMRIVDIAAGAVFPPDDNHRAGYHKNQDSSDCPPDH
jgi:hypothetical protein